MFDEYRTDENKLEHQRVWAAAMVLVALIIAVAAVCVALVFS